MQTSMRPKAILPDNLEKKIWRLPRFSGCRRNGLGTCFTSGKPYLALFAFAVVRSVGS